MTLPAERRPEGLFDAHAIIAHAAECFRNMPIPDLLEGALMERERVA